MGDRDREMEMYERKKENTDRDMCVRECERERRG